MRVAYCDVCGDEIKVAQPVYVLNVENSMGRRVGTDMCHLCMRAVDDFIAERKKILGEGRI
tara:strand:- start:5529 stop:5711 length:183 start_codon:yes stop_codon:yes gene_type:complete